MPGSVIKLRAVHLLRGHDPLTDRAFTANTAEVQFAVQFDPDSLFSNGDPTEDDQASVTNTAG